MLNKSKHIDVREHFIREMVDENRTKLVHVSSDNNLSDIMTKNQSVRKFKIDLEKLLNGEIFSDMGIVFNMYMDDDDQCQRENVRGYIASISNHANNNINIECWG